MYKLIERETIQKKIIERIEEGESLLSISKDKDYPSEKNIYRWLNKYKDFRQNYIHARGIQANFYAEKIESVLANIPAEPTREQLLKARLVIDSNKWIATKLLPKVYGTNQQQTNVQVNIAPITGMDIK